MNATTTSTASTAGVDHTLPTLPPDAVIARLATLLQEMGDLSAYIVNVDDQGAVSLTTFSHQPACSTLPKLTLVNTAVAVDRLDTALAAVKQLNMWRTQGTPDNYVEVRAACLLPDGTPDFARQATEASEPRSDVEPKPDTAMPRLTPEQIKLRIAELLRAVGDLSAYLGDDADSNSAIIATYSPDRSSVTMPAPTGLNVAVTEYKVYIAARALRLYNRCVWPGELRLTHGTGLPPLPTKARDY